MRCVGLVWLHVHFGHDHEILKVLAYVVDGGRVVERCSGGR